ncbi:MAG: DedA family protein [Cohaesibacteraceae bacterium]|nr:DedA family protein [Cohaesibacteraceae bacterium]MBL4875161.1 DedA family protein [Cohaesibacteraceae bacterium]
MLRKLYDWTMDLASSPRASWALGIVSFVESSIFPIPPDTLLIPMVVANRRKAIFYAVLCTVTSVLGGLLGYYIGSALFDQIAKPILDFYGYGAKFDDFAEWFNVRGAWIVFIAGITPFPYKVITIASGATGLGLPVFLVASILARGLRFGIVTALLYFWGQPVREFIEKRLGLVFSVFVILLLGGFVIAKFVF